MFSIRIFISDADASFVFSNGLHQAYCAVCVTEKYYITNVCIIIDNHMIHLDIGTTNLELHSYQNTEFMLTVFYIIIKYKRY